MASCPWPIDIEACCEETGLDPELPEDAAKIERVIEQVSIMMSRWSGFHFGGCRTTRPLDPCGECRSGCCASGDCITLHDASGVSEVRMHGEAVDPAEYHYDASQGTLCAVPPLTWPTRDPRFESVGSLEVDVMIGQEPDAWALAVAAELTCELLLSCSGKKCRLPQNATQVSGQGIVITLSEDTLKYALPAVVSWVNTVNPANAVSPSRIFSPEARRPRASAVRAPWSRF